MCVHAHGFDPLYILLILIVLVDGDIGVGATTEGRNGMATKVIVAVQKGE